MTTATAVTLPTREDWLIARRLGIGASDVAAILGVSPWKSPLQLYAEKRELVSEGEMPEHMEWGLLLEGAIAHRYEVITKRPVSRPDPFTIYHREDPAFAAATLDALTERQGEPGVLEIKNVGFAKAEDWKEEPPLHYQVQLQWQLMVTGHRWGSLAALIGGQRFVYYDMDRNESFIAKMRTAAEEFWQQVQAKTPPRPTGMDAALLSVLYPDARPGSEVMLPAEAITWDTARQQAEEQIKFWKGVKEDADAMLKASIGAHETGLLPDGSAFFTWKTVNRTGYEVKPTSYREMRRKAVK